MHDEVLSLDEIHDEPRLMELSAGISAASWPD